MTDMQHAEIAEQAYFLWLKDGQTHGRAEAHWVAAEAMLAGRKAVETIVKAAKPARKAAARPMPPKGRKAAVVLHA